MILFVRSIIALPKHAGNFDLQNHIVQGCFKENFLAGL